jgi:hypothetical protein
MGCEKFLQRPPGHEIEPIPIIHTGTPGLLAINREAERPHQMKPCAGSYAEAGDISGILRNLRLNEDDMEHGGKNGKKVKA